MPDSIGDLGTSPNVTTRCDQTATDWVFKVGHDNQAVWDWSTSGPPVRELGPVRRPTSTAKSRHAPVRTCSYTTNTVLHLESGLELDLVRAVDRLAEVQWIVPQPVLLRFDHRRGKRKVWHVPDLLTVDRAGAITLWDVKAEASRNETFLLQASLTAGACEHVGWGYLLFDQLPGVARINLMWLHNYRRPQPWYPAAVEEFMTLAEGGVTVGAIVEADPGAGLLTSAMWHLIWTGDLVCDLTTAIDLRTVLRAADE